MYINPLEVAKSINSQRIRPGGQHGDVGVALDALAEDLAAYFQKVSVSKFDENEFLVTAGAADKPIMPRPNPATFSVSPRQGQKRVSMKNGGRHLYYNVAFTVIAVKGAVQFVAERNQFFGGEKSREYRSAVMHNPSWGDVFNAFKESIPVTRDYHHCFLEGVYLATKNHQRIVKDGVTVYCFSSGS